VAYQICEQDALVAAGRFPLLHGAALAAEEPNTVNGIATSGSCLHGCAVWCQPVLQISCHRQGRSHALEPSRTIVSVRRW
jgi:hypothetical protein